MKQVVIENPVLNSPFQEPKRHFRFTEDGITDEIAEERRISQYFVPIPQAKKKSAKQLSFETEWTADRVEENKDINRIRERVAVWRKGGYVGITKITAKLLEYWKREDRERRLFFCQIEALETAIWITEVAPRYGEAWMENLLRQKNQESNPLLYRIAFKMATGSGKTLVMAMLIAWQALNKIANSQDARFSDAFLLVAPGITIKDRLRVLLPNDPQNYYKQHDIVPSDLMSELDKAKFVITNFHTFKLRERVSTGKITKQLLKQTDGVNPFTETPDQMVRRVCRELGNKKNIIVINDEAHHCYRRKPDGQEEEDLKGDDRREAEQREEEARIWISGIEAVKAKLGIKTVYDLSATPFFLRGSGYTEGVLFPWVVSDFSLIDAIESGIVKVPRVPVADDSMTGEQPTYRDLWLRIREHLPKKGRKTEELSIDPTLPVELEGALQSLYSNYEKKFKQWEANKDGRERGQTPPVFIVVCNNTNVSKMVFDYVSGWEKTLKNGENIPVPGKLSLFSNVDHGQWLARPNTILIDSQQLESGEGMTPEFKKIAAIEIEEFKEEYRARFPGRDVDSLADEDILREVMNTVGKAGKLGESVRCVISVSMLTEGWDANTVTHVLGVRAFGTQLLCEQVVGRGLRRRSYAVNKDGMFDAEYAEVYGVPFSFIPSAGSEKTPKTGPTPTRVRALDDRIECEISFPRIIGYRYQFDSEKLTAKFSNDSKMAISTADLPTKTEMQSIIGESSFHELYGLKDERLNKVDFYLAALMMGKYFNDEGNTKPWLFPQLLQVVHEWREKYLTCKDNAFPQMLLLVAFAHTAAEKIYQAIVTSNEGKRTLLPIPRPYDTLGSTRYVDFDTARDIYRTRADKSHISHVVLDSNWEAKLAEVLEDMDEVIHYAKNFQLGFTIPYTFNGEEKAYLPDYLIRLDDGRGKDNLLNLVLEVSGEARKDKAAKVETARNLWIPAINNHGGFGRWAFLEIVDPWDAKNTIQAFIKEGKQPETPLFRGS
ncbi:DEAD/DEAH box helicase family protein [Candidatus Villigracilis affinis]|uniref:BPTD_3080 family restriction endonuclease n=1 Tax=Candidatus Villigracilis affinis TaxID=3140682 RepID=UPI002A1C8785|nr:DEAD/DEAH box helicase family protein [Anaerolineales bacterium]